MDHGDIIFNLFPGTEMEGGTTNLYLCRQGATMEFLPLLGPNSPAAFHIDRGRMDAEGQWRSIYFRLCLVLVESSSACFWHVLLKNVGPSSEMLSLFYVQDVALAHYRMVRTSEYYVSHYVDHTALSHPERGFAVASRQNLLMDGRQPWAIIGALTRGTEYATDASQFYGMASRAGRAPMGLTDGLPSSRLQHEHSMVAIREAEVRLEPEETAERGFYGWFEADHPDASSKTDLVFINKVMGLPEALPGKDQAPIDGSKRTIPTLFTAPLLESLDLTDAEIVDLFGGIHRQEEHEGGRLLSFFTGGRRHVVLKEKELKVLRPHVHILRSGNQLIPDEAGLTSTVWMAGVFNSMVTQGHVSLNRFLSATHSYLCLFREDGLRLFIERDGRWYLLEVPSAFEMTPQECRWIYKHSHGLLVVRSGAPTDRHESTLSFDVLAGGPVRFLVSAHVALNGDDGSDACSVQYVREGKDIFVQPLTESDLGRRFPEGGFLIEPRGVALEKTGGDELLFIDGHSRKQSFFCMITAPTSSAEFHIKGRLIPAPAMEATGEDEVRFWNRLTASLRLHPPAGSPLADAVKRFEEIFPWFIQNALIHYLSPRGIEQYTGGEWGTRDICQGPMEMLLALGRFDPARDLLMRVFRAQNPEGDWPQWFAIFERDRHIRASDSHGDIVFWPIVALCRYLMASEDRKLLDEPLPFFHHRGDRQAEEGTIWTHPERALQVMKRKVIPGTRLAAYGHGDWNDSLQPLEPAMREHLCSAWTVTLHYQALTALAEVLYRFGRPDLASGLEKDAEQIREDFNRLLIVDGFLTGFAWIQEEGRTDYLLHPSDQITGISFRLLPMIHAVINDLFTAEQARRHLDLIRTYLTGPDGARLFDRPLQYRGGLRQIFQRAESAAFFGREIGLMYTHAHLRYTEALARYGDPDGLLLALRQANPIGIRSVVPAAGLRQSNCYYSSSDAAFADRYQAGAEYKRIKRGEVSLDGGWRVYASGPGIWTKLFIQCFLGLRLQKSFLEIDPMMPRSLDGLRVELDVDGRPMELLNHISKTASDRLGYNSTDRTSPSPEATISSEPAPPRLRWRRYGRGSLEARIE